MSSDFVAVLRRHAAGALRLAVVAACAAMVAGCKTTDQTVTGTIPSDYRQRHPIVIKEGPRTVELFIGNKRGTLTGEQRADVLAFANEWRREATGGILIDVPSGSSNQAAGAQALTEVRSILTAAGVPPEAVNIRPNRPRDPNKMVTMRLHYPRIMADAGPCGLWPHDLGPTYERQHLENQEYWNLGCASQRNLAAMVDNPSDLVQPRSEIPPYTGRRTTVLDKYHRGESSATVYPNADKGKISDVGQ
jgi:pilus assembly protein CpaD